MPSFKYFCKSSVAYHERVNSTARTHVCTTHTFHWYNERTKRATRGIPLPQKILSFYNDFAWTGARGKLSRRVLFLTKIRTYLLSIRALVSLRYSYILIGSKRTSNGAASHANLTYRDANKVWRSDGNSQSNNFSNSSSCSSHSSPSNAHIYLLQVKAIFK